MRPLLQIARTEILEHRRQPAMLLVLAANYLVWIALFGALFVLVDLAFQAPEAAELARQQMDALGVDFDAFLSFAISTFGSFLFTNLPLFVAIMSGCSVLHDRTCGTLPFLMLAPITRLQVLAGKLLGAMTLPFLLHLAFVGSSCLLLGRLDLLAPFDHLLGASPSWWLAFLVGAPASAAAVGALGTVISALSPDVRTSMQTTSFFIGLLSLLIGFVLVDAIARGPALQLAFALACLLASGATLLVGARVVSRDVPPH
jgi:ABC-type transport system involved in multi-copper enzyme maturation permease subunit